MSSKIGGTLLPAVEASLRHLLQRQNFLAKGIFNHVLHDDLNPFEKNSLAIAHYYSMEYDAAKSLQCGVLDDFTKRLGSTSDSYLDIGGSLNDLGVIEMSTGNITIAEKHFKRALLMAERSYRVDERLRGTLLCNLAECYRLGHDTERSLQNADSVVQLMNKIRNGASPGRNNFSRETSINFLWAKHLFPAFRMSQSYMIAGRCIGTQRNFEEGLIYFNTSFEILSEPFLKDMSPKFMSMALVDLAIFHQWSLIKRGRSVSTGHIINDSVRSLVQNSIHYENQYHSQLSISSGPKDLLRAAAELDQVSATHVWCGVDAELEARLKSLVSENWNGIEDNEDIQLWDICRGLVGVALLDIPDSKSDENNP